MSKRLQVLLDEDEFDELREVARRNGVPVSVWVRGALREAHRREPSGDVERKLRAIRRAMQYEGPTGDIEQILAETEQGYLSGPGPTE
ncbi:MAG: CopG family transcriptional regulator [Thermoleophilaceae bacterium]